MACAHNAGFVLLTVTMTTAPCLRIRALASLLAAAGMATVAHAEPFIDPAPTPAELQPFVLKGTRMAEWKAADLDGDGRSDYVFVLQKLPPAQAKPDEGDEGKRVLKMAVRSADGKLNVVKTNDAVVYCEQCGGANGDPFMSLDAGPRKFSVTHAGGGGPLSWSNTVTFNYSRIDSSWQLVRVETTTSDNFERTKAKVRTYKPPRDFGKIDIADFNPQKYLGVGPK